MASGEPKGPHVLIIGGGIGGLFLAQFLRKRDVSFEVFERDTSPEARDQGWALGLHMLDEFQSHMPDDVPPLRAACHLLPLDIISQVILYPPGGARIGVQDTPATPCLRTNRKRLRGVLSTGVPIQWGKKAERIEEEAGKVTVWFEDGSSAVGNVLVGADGTWSKVREHVLGKPNEQVLDPVPTSLIFGETKLTGEDMWVQMRLGHSGWARFGPGFTIFCGLNELLPAGDSGMYYWIFFTADDDVANPQHWLRAASSQEKYDYVVKKLGVFEDNFTQPVKVGGVNGILDKFLLFYDCIIEELPVSRVTLLGDAAHSVPPFRGEGGIMAIKDALELADVLAKMDVGDEAAVRAALDGYQKVITKRGSDTVKLARDLGANAKAAPKLWGHDVSNLPEEPMLGRQPAMQVSD